MKKNVKVVERFLYRHDNCMKVCKSIVGLTMQAKLMQIVVEESESVLCIYYLL